MAFDALAINPGDLRHTITIQAPNTAAPDGFGQVTSAWKDVLTTKAAIRGLSLRELAQDGTLVSQTTHLITIRYPGRAIRIVPGQRIVGGSCTYQVQAIDDVLNRNRILRLQCVVIDEASA